MPRTVDRQRRHAIAERAADHLLERGLVGVSLRELAAAVGVSPRMLVHHFGSREGLISCALREARARQREAFEARLAAQPGRPYADVLADAWHWLATAEAEPFLRLFGQLHALAGAPDSPYAEFARRSVLDWLPIIEEGFAADGADPVTARELTTLSLAVIRGLLQDRNALGDRRRVSAAFDCYASLLGQARAAQETAPRSPQPPRGRKPVIETTLGDEFSAPGRSSSQEGAS